ncbi:hypothetical protein SAMN02746041_02811 [Desulfacinum hydrothermale DSM 13146]|uniref:Uncharacterized protein n=1 Tax=Desulfacinum hydrothermale DSM 13146 TaxID=1121390 RepID=A0A1W1XSI0_9BACT|nr:hypothetical protein [Desulfacinum hydrothermale]SMC26919.1 hypothetical protein SAMN02746041_02811 [Desulfacinum hydrothermale DSM 13146]
MKEELEKYVFQRERTLLETLVHEAVEGVPRERRSAVKAAILSRARLHRLEHGGSFVTVRVGEEWLPLDRAVDRLASGPEGT